jgi:hypothetical protein
MTLKGRSFCLSFVLALFAGCAQIPTAELTQYRNATAEVQKAAEVVLIDFAAIIEAKEAEKKRSEEGTAPREPAIFSTELAHGAPAALGPIAVRRIALRTIDTYNNALTTLAEGKSVEAVQNAAGSAIEAGKNLGAALAKASGAVPGFGALVSGVQTLVGELEKARLREEFAKAVRNGSKTIREMLDVLIADRQEHIDLRADAANLRHKGLLTAINVQVQSVLTLVREHSAPTAGDQRENIEKALNGALRPAARFFSTSLPLRLAYGDQQKAAFSTDHRIAAIQAVSQITERVGEVNANFEQHQKLQSALNSYGAMLRDMQEALGKMEAALDKPQSIEDFSEKLFATAFTIKKDVEAFRAARKTAE